MQLAAQLTVLQQLTQAPEVGLLSLSWAHQRMNRPILSLKAALSAAFRCCSAILCASRSFASLSSASAARAVPAEVDNNSPMRTAGSCRLFNVLIGTVTYCLGASVPVAVALTLLLTDCICMMTGVWE